MAHILSFDDFFFQLFRFFLKLINRDNGDLTALFFMFLGGLTLMRQIRARQRE
jgi:hypothetical protein